MDLMLLTTQSKLLLQWVVQTTAVFMVVVLEAYVLATMDSLELTAKL